MPADETTDSRHRRGAVSFCPSTHTHTQAKYHQPYRSRGGSKPAYGTLGRENGRGHWSAGAGGLVARRRTDNGGRAMGGTGHWRGASEYTFMDGEEAERTNGERRRARCAEEQGARTNLGGGKKEGTNVHLGRET